MTLKPAPSKESIRAIVGHRFPGGKYTIEHWENFLLTECTGADPLPDGLAHPVALFHVPILGARTSIGEMFALGQAEADNSIHIESYDWEFFQPLKERVEYDITAGYQLFWRSRSSVPSDIPEATSAPANASVSVVSIRRAERMEPTRPASRE